MKSYGDTLDKVLGRIDLRMDALNLCDLAVGKRAGKPDLIYSMRKQWKKGTQKRARRESLEILAKVLDVDLDWLAKGSGDEQTQRVWVVMSNDFPDAVFTSEAAANAYCKGKMNEQKKEMPSPRIYYHNYEFEVRE
jgi:hypothetical protein